MNLKTLAAAITLFASGLLSATPVHAGSLVDIEVLARAGFVPVVFDNLATGWAAAVKFGPLVQGDLADRAALDTAFARYRPVAVMHFAALSLVGESVANPGKTEPRWCVIPVSGATACMAGSRLSANALASLNSVTGELR